MAAPAPTVYRSTDTNAPVLNGAAGSLVDVLTACLVNGYGSAFASGSITNDGTIPADGDMVTVGSITYTFKTSIAAQPVNSVLIGATAVTAVLSLSRAINGTGTAGTDYPAGTVANPDAYTTATATPLPIVARKGGSAGNAITLARASAGTPHFSVSGATLTGGGGTDSKTGAGWTRPFAATGAAVFRQGAGNQFYLDVNDNGPGAGGSQEARLRGYEVMTAVGTGTAPFPTAAQATPGIVVRKAASAGPTARVWTLIADDRTFYLFVQTGDTAGVWHCFSFGDTYSYVTGTDNFRTFIMGRIAEASTAGSSEWADQEVTNLGVLTGHYMTRSYTGLGGSVQIGKTGDGGKGSATLLAGFMAAPNPVDGAIWLSPVFSCQNNIVRGELRGFMHWLHTVGSFADQDTVAGAGAFAGRTFLLFRTTGNGGAYCMDITGPWKAN